MAKTRLVFRASYGLVVPSIALEVAGCCKCNETQSRWIYTLVEIAYKIYEHFPSFPYNHSILYRDVSCFLTVRMPIMKFSEAQMYEDRLSSLRLASLDKSRTAFPHDSSCSGGANCMFILQNLVLYYLK